MLIAADVLFEFFVEDADTEDRIVFRTGDRYGEALRKKDFVPVTVWESLA